MNKNTMLVIGGVVIVAVVLLGKSLISNNSAANQEVTNQVSITDDTDQQTTTPAEQKNTSWYTAYSPEALAAATADDQKAVIFFHASWCPSCLAAAEDFEANADRIPSDVTILKADYDTEKELKKKYNVVTQDTFVQVDSKGKVLAIWNSGGEGIKTLLANIK